MKTVVAVLVILALGVGIAPLALAASPQGLERHDLDQMDVAHAVKAFVHLAHHPQMFSQLPAEKAIFLLQGLNHLARNPFIDRDQLFEVQVRLTLRLLDLQVQRLQTVFPQPLLFPTDNASGKHRTMMQPMMGKMSMRDRLITKVDQFSFYSPRGCQLNQSKVARQNTLRHNLFVGPCQTVGEESWGFNVWKI